MTLNISRSGGTHRTLNYDMTLNRFRAQNADFSWFSFDFPGNLSSGASIGRLIIIGRLIGLGVRGHLPDATSYDANYKNQSTQALKTLFKILKIVPTLAFLSFD